MCTCGGQTCTWDLPKQTRLLVHSPRFCSFVQPRSVRLQKSCARLGAKLANGNVRNKTVSMCTGVIVVARLASKRANRTLPIAPLTGGNSCVHWPPNVNIKSLRVCPQTLGDFFATPSVHIEISFASTDLWKVRRRGKNKRAQENNKNNK